MNYNQSGLNKGILHAVEEMGFEQMTPIQQRAIPVMMEGRDLVGQAQTGTGKTAAFGIPLIQKIQPESHGIQALVLCPTRELAIQATEELRRFSKYIKGIKIAPVFGGQDMSKQIQMLKNGTKIVVGTPGRIMDHMRRRTLKLDGIQTVVLDEADEMLNMGFREDIETILGDTPKERQTVLFSATMPQAILNITKKYQKDAALIKTTKKELTIPLVEQFYFELKGRDKTEALCRLLDYHDPKRTLIFCKTKRGADALSGELKGRGYPAEPLHGDLSQGQRNAAMAQFRHGKASILVATDVAARGLDVDDVEAVFNYDIPQEEEAYVHRIGRTGRAGKEGKAFTFVVGKEIYKLRSIEGYCRTHLTKGTLPSAVSVMKSKSEKILNQAIQMSENRDLRPIGKLLHKKVKESGYSVEYLAAALLQMQMGDEIAEISQEPHRAMPSGKKKKKEGRRRQPSGRRRN
ncbi:DEAD/DEAH box helicase [Anaerovorax odorimutans]|uniref:DEAD/DEAH box helicase n=2 Tax=Anaerovorax odorimutans TaxID=109327 RepID=A0ABT1RLT3_9FIRM|nr:DEAD/DEAH box helicase [Anaerovorax odorimutans]